MTERASLAEQLAYDQNKQFTYSKKRFSKHFEEFDEVEWHEPGSLYAYGNWHLNYCMDGLTECEECFDSICQHEASICMKCNQTICGLHCCWRATLTVKDPKCKLYEFTACPDCKDELDPDFSNLNFSNFDLLSTTLV